MQNRKLCQKYQKNAKMAKIGKKARFSIPVSRPLGDAILGAFRVGNMIGVLWARRKT